MADTAGVNEILEALRKQGAKVSDVPALVADEDPTPASSLAEKANEMAEKRKAEEPVSQRQLVRNQRQANMSFRDELIKILEEQDAHPVRELINMYKMQNDDGSFSLPMKERIGIMKTILEYVGPKLKATDVHKEIQQNTVVVIKQFGKSDPTPAKRVDGKVVDV